MLFIAYRDKPDEHLFSFSSAGDSVGIGRDKRTCKICLGAQAQGVSRVHMNIELKRVNGKNTLVATDRSTYGTGYNGNALSVVKERQLKAGDVLQIGTFFFTIGGQGNESDEDDDVILEPAPEPAKDRKSMKRSSAVDDRGEIKRTKLAGKETVAAKDASGTSKKVAQKNNIASLLMRGKKTALQKRDIATSDSNVAEASSEKQQSDSERRRHAAAAFLPSSDEEEDSCFSYRFKNRRKTSAEVFAADTASQNMKARPSFSRAKEEENGNTTIVGNSCAIVAEEPKSDRVVQTRLTSILKCTPAIESHKSPAASPVLSDADEAVVECPKNGGDIGDIDSHMPLQPLINSTQVGHETSPLRENRRLDLILEELAPSTSDLEKSAAGDVPGGAFMDAKTLRRTPRKRKAIVEECSLVVKSRNRRNALKIVEADDVPVARKSSPYLTSRAPAVEKEKKPEDAAEKVVVKAEPVDYEENVPDIINKTILGEQNPVKVKKEEVIVKEEPVEEEKEADNLVFGMDLETVRQKLEKAVQFESLERKSFPRQYSEDVPRGYSLPNYKRFKKAAQGCFNEAVSSLETVKSQIIGSCDLIDHLA